MAKTSHVRQRLYNALVVRYGQGAFPNAPTPQPQPLVPDYLKNVAVTSWGFWHFYSNPHPVKMLIKMLGPVYQLFFTATDPHTGYNRK